MISNPMICDHVFLHYAILTPFIWMFVAPSNNTNLDLDHADDNASFIDHETMSASRCGSTHFYCDGDCIPTKWKCDREIDCFDRTDEPPDCSPATCSPSHFQCRLTGICLPISYRCDREFDCGSTADGRVDRSDEDEHHCYHSLSCPPNRHKCQIDDVCIELKKFCDGYVDCIDGSDEGTFCEIPAVNDVACAYGRKPTPPDGVFRCFCPKGQKPRQNKCVDDDECSREEDGSVSPCEQNCTNLVRGYQCGCIDGYELIGKKDCRAVNEPADENATIIFINDNSIIHTDLNFSTVYGKIEARINKGMDFDHRNRSVCWIAIIGNEWEGEKFVIQCASIDKFHKNLTWFYEPEFSLARVQQMVKDWVTGNWYFNDHRIFVCDDKFLICKTIVTLPSYHPNTDLAIDPMRSYMFVASELGIFRWNMDGTKFFPLANLSIIYPSRVTLDYAKRTVYWLDKYSQCIYALDYEAEDKIRIVATGHHLKYLRSLTLFEKYLYATDYQNDALRISKNKGISIKIFTNEAQVGAYGIRVFHRQRQPRVDHPCTVNNGGCDHLCLVSYADKMKGVAKCACREGYMLIAEKKCSEALSFPFLLLGKARGNIDSMIMGIPLNKPDAGYQSITPIMNMEGISFIFDSPTFTFLAETSEIYFVDKRFMIMKQKLNSNSKHIVIDSGISSCHGLAMDWVSKNLYWSDEKLKTINVAQLQNIALKKVIASTNLSLPRAVAVHPHLGYVFWSDSRTNSDADQWVAKIERSNLDGSDRRALVTNNLHWPNGLTIDFQNDLLFWCDLYYNQIEKASLDGSQRETIVRQIDQPSGITNFDGFLFWSELHTGKIKRINLNETKLGRRKEAVTIYEDPSLHAISSLSGIQVYDVDRRRNASLCSGKTNGGCDHFCFFINVDAKCDCADGFVISSTDSKLCIPVCRENLRNNSVECVCPSKYNDTNCAKNVSCDGYCLNGGSCEETSEKVECSCTRGYTGTRCQQFHQIIFEDDENLGKTIAIVVAPLILISLSGFLIYIVLHVRRHRCVRIQFKHTRMLDKTVENPTFLRRKENDLIISNEMETNFSNQFETRTMV